MASIPKIFDKIFGLATHSTSNKVSSTADNHQDANTLKHRRALRMTFVILDFLFSPYDGAKPP